LTAILLLLSVHVIQMIRDHGARLPTPVRLVVLSNNAGSGMTSRRGHVPTMGAGVILFLTLLATTEALFTPEEIQAILNQQNTFRRLVVSRCVAN